MRHGWVRRTATVCGWALGLGLLAGPAGAQGLNLLFFGNSFTFGGAGVDNMVRDLATAGGHDTPFVVSDLEGGKDFDYHLGQITSNPSGNVNPGGLGSNETWDYVIMQGFSTEATSTKGDGTFEQDALDLYRAVANHGSGHGAGVTGVLYQTWARGPGHDYYEGSGPLYPDPAAMQADVRNGYASAHGFIESREGSGSSMIAPVGDAFEELDFDLSLYGSDIYHASDAGYLLAAMVIYRTIYDVSVSDLNYNTLSGSLTSEASASQWASLAVAADSVAIPEPATLGLMALGLAVLGRRRR